MKQAKLTINVDVASLRNSINQAKTVIESMNGVKIKPETFAAVKDAFGADVQRQIEETGDAITQVKKRVEELAKSNFGILSDDFRDATKKAGELENKLKDLVDLKKDLAKGDISVKGPTGGGGGMPVPVPGAKGGGGNIMNMLGPLAMGMGIMGSIDYSKRVAMERTSIRSLTGGNDVGERSALGYDHNERRQRATSIASSLGRNTSSEELNNLTDLGERSERAFGVGQDTMSGAMTANRKAGVEDQQKQLLTSMGTAVANGLEGSRVGEYLSAMTGFMEEMSDSITVSPESINGFAGAFGNIPFFKNDPSRMFRQMSGMDSAFKDGDRFQQAMGARAMLKENGGANPAELELRRSLGLFGNSKDLVGAFDGVKGAGGLQKTLGIDGNKILKNQFDESMSATEGMDAGTRVHSVMSRMGLQGEGGMNIVAKLMKGQSVTKEDMAKNQMTPAELADYEMSQRISKTLTGQEKATLDMAADIEEIKKQIADNITTGITKIVSIMDKIAEFFGVSDGTKAAAVVGTAAVAGVAANQLTKAVTGKGITELGKSAATKIPGAGSSTVAGRMASGLSKAGGFGLGIAIPGDLADDDGTNNPFNEINYAMNQRKAGSKASFGSADIPWAGGLTKKEADASKMVNPLNITTPNPSAEVLMPSNMTVNDPGVVNAINNLANAITGRPQIQTRTPSQIPVFNGNVGVNR